MKKRILYALAKLLLAAILAALLGIAAFAETEGCGTVTASALNLRSDASTASSVVTTVYKGSTVLLTGKTNGWYKVWYNGSTGYMSADYLSVSETGTANFGTGSILGSDVRVRSGASTSSSILATCSSGTTMSVNGVNGAWLQVSYNGSTGYVHSDYLSLSAGGSASSGSGTGSSTTTQSGVINASYVRLRGGASTSSTILATLDKGASLSITGSSGDWYAVTVNGSSGYVYKTYVSVDGSGSSSSAGSSSANKSGVINASYVRLRSGASTSSSILSTLSKGASLTVTGSSGDWYAVTVNGSSGYVYKTYVSVGDNSSGSSSSVTAASGTGTIKGSGVRIRKDASTASDILATVYSGTTMTVTGTTGDWYQVSYNGSTGYVYNAYLSVGDNSSGSSSGSSSSAGEAIVTEAKKYLGVPYVYGGTSPSGFDCSGLVYYVYKQLGYSIYRTATAQYQNGVYVDRSALQPGDIIIFYNSACTAIGHAGLYIGDGQFIHASSGSGKVIISNLSQTYYNTRYYGARRVV